MDEYTEITNESWFGRIGKSFKNIIIGIILFLGSFVLLFWNEGRAVKRYRTLEEGLKSVISVPADNISPENEGKLVHISAKVFAKGILKDKLLGVSAKNVIKLKRIVQMYQWEEHSRTKTRKKLGGGRQRIKTYYYEKKWSEELINSGSFKRSSGHENPDKFPFTSTEFISADVQAGYFKLSSEVIRELNDYTSFPLRRIPEEAKKAYNKKCVLGEGALYFGDTPRAPEIGDMKVVYKIIKPYLASIIACQEDGRLVPYKTKSGGELLIVEKGDVAADKMFKKAIEANKFLTNILRLVGFGAMVLGIVLILGPLAVFADIIPFLGGAVGIMSFIIAILIALPLSLITIAIAWIFYRPLIAAIIIMIALGIGILLFTWIRRGVRVV